MNQEHLSALPLSRAAFCVDCEIVSDSPHHVCAICGSHALIGLSRLLGGTLHEQRKAPVSTAKYDLELTATVHDVPAPELNRVIEAVTRLIEFGGTVKSIHINVDSTQAALDSERVLKAA